jgi:DNA-binding winged helix-turn-helix (wHTH) protein
VRFGVFELDRAAGQLFRKSQPVKLPPQPMAMLIALVNKAGQEVTREELAALWPAGTFVDFEAGIGSCVHKIRLALGDNAENPMFVKTIHGRGFCFIAAVQIVFPEALEAVASERPFAVPARSRAANASNVEDVASDAPANLTNFPIPAAPLSPEAKIVPLRAAPRHRGTWRIVLACCVAALVAGGIVIWKRAYPAPPDLDRVRPFANARGHQSRPAFSPNGEILAFDWMGPADRHACIYLQRLDGATPARLTSGLLEEYGLFGRMTATESPFCAIFPRMNTQS